MTAYLALDSIVDPFKIRCGEEIHYKHKILHNADLASIEKEEKIDLNDNAPQPNANEDNEPG